MSRKHAALRPVSAKYLARPHKNFSVSFIGAYSGNGVSEPRLQSLFGEKSLWLTVRSKSFARSPRVSRAAPTPLGTSVALTDDMTTEASLSLYIRASDR